MLIKWLFVWVLTLTTFLTIVNGVKEKKIQNTDRTDQENPEGLTKFNKILSKLPGNDNENVPKKRNNSGLVKKKAVKKGDTSEADGENIKREGANSESESGNDNREDSGSESDHNDQKKGKSQSRENIHRKGKIVLSSSNESNERNDETNTGKSTKGLRADSEEYPEKAKRNGKRKETTNESNDAD